MQLTAQRKQVRTRAICQKAKIANANEPEGKDVLDKAPQELHRSKRHLALFIAVRVVLPAEGHGVAIDVE